MAFLQIITDNILPLLILQVLHFPFLPPDVWKEFHFYNIHRIILHVC